MTAVGAALRWLHLAAGVGLVGLFVALLAAGRSDKPTARAWQARMAGWARLLVLVALPSGLGLLAHQVAHVAGRLEAVGEAASWATVLGQTRFGTVWTMRHVLLVLVAALLALREAERSTADWIAFRVQALLLGGGGLAALAWAGHGAAADAPGGIPAALVDGVHLLAAGAWLGALLPLAALVRAAATEAGADARPAAVLAMRRFSGIALAAMLVLLLTGAANAWALVGDVAGLVGTPYGRLLLAKLALLVGVLGLAAFNRSRLLPRIGGPAASVGRPAMARLARLVTAECALGLAMVGTVSVLAVTPPALHDAPWWPLAWRLDWTATLSVPGGRPRVLIGAQIAVLGAVAAIAAVVARRHLAIGLGAGATLLTFGLGLSLPPLAVDAYPTTYVRAGVPYHALSVARGLELFRAQCTVCHGPGGQGDGPGARDLPRPPADLTAPHTGQHTAGDLFWWLTHGIRAGGMPPFGPTLSEEDRWDVINYLRALASATEARSLAPAVEPDRPRIAAVDGAFSAGAGPAQSIKDFRGRQALLLVLFTLPGSHERLVQLAQSYELLRGLGAEVLAVPQAEPEAIITRIGASNPPILYPVVTEGSADIAAAYGLFRRTLSPDGLRPDPPMPRHMELLVDRNGYLRARWIPGEDSTGWANPSLLAAELQRLAREAPAPPPAEHVH